MYSMALINADRMKESSIVDIFCRRSLFFWSEEAREFQKKTRKQIFYMNVTPVSLEGIQKYSQLFGVLIKNKGLHGRCF
jgi:hypothetical protein